ncbi:MAG: acetate--CoA ligase family protein [Bacteroidales bacterium]|nr:acetate--CoA ligase family protein [Bacteroidales bacterium]MCL2132980.1 acetate--CoA ligase family protein [Bacteroidales bacterium]
MLTEQLLNPKSIVIVGGSADTGKPGGSVIKNLINQGYKGKIYVVNPKASEVQGIPCHASVEALPEVDLAMLAIPAVACVEAVKVLAYQKKTKGFIIFSAGFHEESAVGAALEEQIVQIVNETGGSLIGPNCIGVMNTNYAGVFTGTIPPLSGLGVDFITGSGATAVFLMQAAMRFGLPFAGVYSVGNSAQTGVEEVLAHMDETYVHGQSAPVKMLYVESINNPDKLLKHAQSLIKKGARITAIKAGSSEAGSRAASSHTGALASPDAAVSALFKKAGIIRCRGRMELALMAAVLLQPLPLGKNIAIITHAGGPAVMLTDVLSNGGLQIPPISGPAANELLSKLYHGSSVANPIDFLATGTAEQLGCIIDACENNFDHIDAMAVIFGNPGLAPLDDVYALLLHKMKTCKKPIYAILTSIADVPQELPEYIKNGKVAYQDEVLFGETLSAAMNSKNVQKSVQEDVQNSVQYSINKQKIREIVDGAADGYLMPDKVQALLDAAGIPRAGEAVVTTADDAVKAAGQLGYPVVMKVVGPIHKSDVGGVVLNVKNDNTVRKEFERMMQIKDTTAILLQPQLSGVQLFVGANREPKFGHLIMCGLGGIFIEVLKDVAAGLAPLSMDEAYAMIRSLRSYKIIEGVRGQDPVNEAAFAEIIVRLSMLCEAAPEIAELDLNPLLGAKDKVVAVDARIRINNN